MAKVQYYKSALKDKIQAKPKSGMNDLMELVLFQPGDQEVEDVRQSDLAFVAVIEAVATNKKLMIFKRFVEISEYCQNENMRMQALRDIARLGNPLIFQYFIEKFKIDKKQIDFIKLVNVAVTFGNLKMLPFLVSQITLIQHHALDEKAVPELDTETLMIKAFRSGHINVVEWLSDNLNFSVKKLQVNDLIRTLFSPLSENKLGEQAAFILSNFEVAADDQKSLLRILCKYEQFTAVSELIRTRKVNALNAKIANELLFFALGAESLEGNAFAEALIANIPGAVVTQETFHELLKNKNYKAVHWCLNHGTNLFKKILFIVLLDMVIKIFWLDLKWKVFRLIVSNTRIFQP